MDPVCRCRRQSEHRALQRGASERARGQVVDPSHLRVLDGVGLNFCPNAIRVGNDQVRPVQMEGTKNHACGANAGCRRGKSSLELRSPGRDPDDHDVTKKGYVGLPRPRLETN
jgi:hypothetical protein